MEVLILVLSHKIGNAVFLTSKHILEVRTAFPDWVLDARESLTSYKEPAGQAARGHLQGALTRWRDFSQLMQAFITTIIVTRRHPSPIRSFEESLFTKVVWCGVREIV